MYALFMFSERAPRNEDRSLFTVRIAAVESTGLERAGKFNPSLAA